MPLPKQERWQQVEDEAQQADDECTSLSDAESGSDGNHDGGEEPEPDEEAQVDEKRWLGRVNDEVEDARGLGKALHTRKNQQR